MEQAEKIIPHQEEGAKTGANFKKETPTRHEAINLYNEAKKRLLDINNWDRLCGKASAKFRICDKNGNLMQSPKPEVGSLIRIELPAPPNGSGRGYDWVRIEEFIDEKNMMKDEEIFGFRVRPVPDPKDETGKATAHFFTADATSTFLVHRSTNEVTAMEKGRNEKPNTGPSGWLNRIRNVVVALAAMAGFSTPQWKSLVNGIINGKEEYKYV